MMRCWLSFLYPLPERSARLNLIASFADSPRGMALQQRIINQTDTILNDSISIQQIPAPTFDESRRATHVCQQFAGLHDVDQDALFNVYGRLPGTDSTLPALLITAHTDTVFPEGTNLTIHRQNGRIIGPGIGDNSLGVGALLGLIRLLRDQPLKRDVWFVANTREEGLGDLGGMRAVVEKLGKRVSECIVIEGMAYGQIYHAGIAVRRLRIAAHAPGGHSWLHFGQPSAIHALMRFGAQITTIQPPTAPRTTYNIGLIEGGQSVNSIATDASLTLDLRSENPDTLAALEKEVLRRLDACREPDIDFKVEVVGDRPAGSIPATHPLVQAARQTLEAIGTQPVFRTGSTDANLPLAHGLPAVTIGITHGSNAHRLDEYIETAAIPHGMWQLTLLALHLAGNLG